MFVPPFSHYLAVVTRQLLLAGASAPQLWFSKPKAKAVWQPSFINNERQMELSAKDIKTMCRLRGGSKRRRNQEHALQEGLRAMKTKGADVPLAQAPAPFSLSVQVTCQPTTKPATAFPPAASRDDRAGHTLTLTEYDRMAPIATDRLVIAALKAAGFDVSHLQPIARAKIPLLALPARPPEQSGFTTPWGGTSPRFEPFPSAVARS